jgi:hypothetical protein
MLEIDRAYRLLGTIIFDEFDTIELLGDPLGVLETLELDKADALRLGIDWRCV